MNILARQLVIDMYNCKPEKLQSAPLLSDALKNTLSNVGFTPSQPYVTTFDENHFIIFIPLDEGHLTIHAYPTLKYAAIDLFICKQNNLPEKAVHALRKVVKPEEIKMTYLCRGDFGTISDMKPHIKIKMAPLRRIQNTGVKVIHLLPGRNLMKKLRRKK
ncbi:S-adenosylmethionine decarboxylase family protein [Pectinatus cerevisiiphilus]|uniref:S-adenosylmethionine decarboxylase n=1 Tax=Pectinatus cerevisiiphilus TaxID=86956 RepID=A0A4R3K8P7_9FIRM|nr:S-adenosylmethionine decarboxylase [Pectinatus cerevisiiphilus]TCS79265.1 S-adenosylmethionine decarboxylase [Pectinatus cerevisiiphilus]